MRNTSLINKLKNDSQDFEWYPTTNEMIECIKNDMIIDYYDYDQKQKILIPINILDCGAGDGRVVESLSNGGKKYAIEKSKILIQEMSKDIFIIGTDFFQTTLIDKKVNVIFCNPPYTEYEDWASKIIFEAKSKIVYLILPERWTNSESIKHAMDIRDVKGEVIGSFDFLNAERSARAKVNIIKIYITKTDYRENDPFNNWFDENFKLKEQKNSFDEGSKSETLKEKCSNQITKSRGISQILVELYNQEMEHLQKMFLSVCELDPDILDELDVNRNSLKDALKLRITGLKNKYWKELFDNYKMITSRLTLKSRKKMLDKLTDNMTVDFTNDNIYAITIWVIKNANEYYNTQLVEVVERIINKANVQLYKSNKRVFEDDEWFYCRKPEKLKNYGLELRIIMDAIGGLDESIYSHYRYTNNLSDNAHEFIDDLLTIANNFGFQCKESSKTITDSWKSNKTQTFFTDKDTLMTVKAFKNGNLHIKFNQKLIRTINVEFGRLKGWLKNHKQASEELNIPEMQTKNLFKSNYSLTQSNGLIQIGLNN